MRRKSAKKKPSKPNRARAVPLQVMLAASEADDIAVIAAARGVSKSTLVRAWIRRAIARSKPGAVVYVDPRQEALFPLAAAPPEA
jgi:hypothetical protein